MAILGMDFDVLYHFCGMFHYRIWFINYYLLFIVMAILVYHIGFSLGGVHRRGGQRGRGQSGESSGAVGVHLVVVLEKGTWVEFHGVYGWFGFLWFGYFEFLEFRPRSIQAPIFVEANNMRKRRSLERVCVSMLLVCVPFTNSHTKGPWQRLNLKVKEQENQVYI